MRKEFRYHGKTKNFNRRRFRNESRSFGRYPRRIMQKALDNIAQMGAEDYYDPIFADYANLLFDFGQVRIKMRNLKDQSVEPGRISSKKFIEGFLLRMTAQ